MGIGTNTIASVSTVAFGDVLYYYLFLFCHWHSPLGGNRLGLFSMGGLIDKMCIGAVRIGGTSIYVSHTLSKMITTRHVRTYSPPGTELLHGCSKNQNEVIATHVRINLKCHWSFMILLHSCTSISSYHKRQGKAVNVRSVKKKDKKYLYIHIQ